MCRYCAVNQRVYRATAETRRQMRVAHGHLDARRDAVNALLKEAPAGTDEGPAKIAEAKSSSISVVSGSRHR